MIIRQEPKKERPARPKTPRPDVEAAAAAIIAADVGKYPEDSLMGRCARMVLARRQQKEQEKTK